MSWSSHIDHVANKFNSAYFAIVNLKNILTTKHFRCILCTCSQPPKYMILFWGNAMEVDQIFILQKRILHKIFSLCPIDSCQTFFQTHNLLTLPCILPMKAAVFTEKHLRLFPPVSTVYQHYTQNNNNILIETYNLSTYRKSLTVSVVPYIINYQII